MRRWRQVLLLSPMLIAACGAPAQQAPDPSLPPVQSRSLSCVDERGAEPARILANRCRLVSPATRPPCHPANACSLIEDEIARACVQLAIEAPECSGPTDRARQRTLYNEAVTPP